MTFNLRCDFILDFNNRWDIHKHIAVDLIKNYKCDFIGVQEATKKMHDYLCDNKTNVYLLLGENSIGIYKEGNDLLSVLQKAVCAVYISTALVVGGVAAYMKFTLDESGYFNVESNKKENDLKKNGQVVNVDSNLCIREDADINSEVIYMLYEGMTFKILDKKEEWYNINYNDNIIGYVNEQYVEEYEDTPPYETYDEREKNMKEEELSNAELEPINVELTAYCNCKICSENWGSATAMQTQTRKGVVAAPKEITLGSRLYIPDLKDYKEDGIFDVEDRGGAVKVKDDGTYIIDVWLQTHEEVKEFGRKKSTIYLIKN